MSLLSSIGGAVAFGLPAFTIASGAAALGGVAGALRGAPPPPAAEPSGQAPQQHFDDFGPQQNIQGLMNMIGAPQIQMNQGNLIGGGGLI